MLIADALGLGIAAIAVVTAATRGEDTVTSTAERDRALAFSESRCQTSRDEVLEMAGGFCGLVERSGEIADYEQTVTGYFVEAGLSLRVADAPEITRSFGGTLDSRSNRGSELLGLTT